MRCRRLRWALVGLAVGCRLAIPARTNVPQRDWTPAILTTVPPNSPFGVPDTIAGVLSAREVEVLLLLDDHLGTDEIATRLFISEHTVRSHVKSLLRKLGVSSRRQALETLAAARG